MKPGDVIYILSSHPEPSLDDYLSKAQYPFSLVSDLDRIETLEPCLCVLVSIDSLEHTKNLFSKIRDKFGRSIAVVPIVCEPTTSQTIQLMKLGAINLIERPITQMQVEEVLNEVILSCDHNLNAEQAVIVLSNTVSHREKQVLKLVVMGWSSKAIAEELQITVSTVDNHRARLMRKLGAESSADLARIALKLDPTLGDDS